MSEATPAHPPARPPACTCSSVPAAAKASMQGGRLSGTSPAAHALDILVVSSLIAASSCRDWAFSSPLRTSAPLTQHRKSGRKLLTAHQHTAHGPAAMDGVRYQSTCAETAQGRLTHAQTQKATDHSLVASLASVVLRSI